MVYIFVSLKKYKNKLKQVKVALERRRKGKGTALNITDKKECSKKPMKTCECDTILVQKVHDKIEMRLSELEWH